LYYLINMEDLLDHRDVEIKFHNNEDINKSAATVESDTRNDTVDHLSREKQYLRSYDAITILRKIPDLINCLSTSTINSQARAITINWIVKVCFKQLHNFDYPEIFQSITIFDLYLKR